MMTIKKEKEKKVKRVKREKHSFWLFEDEYTSDVRDALLDIGTPVTFEKNVKETSDGKLFKYDITVLATNMEWDLLNRRLGALGFIGGFLEEE